MSKDKYRLVTRADFDGVVCGALLMEQDMIDDVVFAHPRDLQDGVFPASAQDITANLPYLEPVHLCFDHHVSETERADDPRDNHVIDPDAPSAARVVFKYFGGKEGFPEIPDGLVDAVDQADAGQYTEEDILAPDGWTLLNFILDGRTGLGHFCDFAISKEQLMREMMTYCRHHPVDEILQIPDVHERVAAYLYEKEFAELQIRRCATVRSNVVIVDLRGEETIHAVNRFLVYALYPQCNVSVHLTPAPDGSHVEIAVGKSILDRSLEVNVGSLMLEHGGGGHRAVGTCRADVGKEDEMMEAVVSRLIA